MTYKVKSKSFKSYNAAVNWSIAKKAPISDEMGRTIPTICVGELVEFNKDYYLVTDINTKGVVLYGINNKVAVYGETLMYINNETEV